MSRFRIFPIEKMSHQHHFKTSYLNWMKLNWLNFSFLVCLHFSAVTITWIGIFQIIFRVGLKKASIFRIKASKVTCFDKQMWKKNFHKCFIHYEIIRHVQMLPVLMNPCLVNKLFWHFECFNYLTNQEMN